MLPLSTTDDPIADAYCARQRQRDAEDVRVCDRMAALQARRNGLRAEGDADRLAVETFYRSGEQTAGLLPDGAKERAAAEADAVKRPQKIGQWDGEQLVDAKAIEALREAAAQAGWSVSSVRRRGGQLVASVISPSAVGANVVKAKNDVADRWRRALERFVEAWLTGGGVCSIDWLDGLAEAVGATRMRNGPAPKVTWVGRRLGQGP